MLRLNPAHGFTLKLKPSTRSIMKIQTLILLFSMVLAQAATHIRYNHAGYTPDRSKSLIVMSDASLAGAPWSISLNGTEVLAGTFGASLAGIGIHTPKAFNHRVDFSALDAVGTYVFNFASGTAELKIDEDPYSFIIPQILHHLRVERSGTSETALHQASHLGDSAAILYHISGSATNGEWAEVLPRQTIDMRGGWYDAGDYIKFTLTTAYTAYFLLRAYEANPGMFHKVYSTSNRVDVLDEAKHGLDYLMKTFPSANEFIIQVSSGDDHRVGYRMPESDTRDGSREAFSAISKPHMGYTAAALALGARIFKAEGETALAQTYGDKAEAIYNRALQADAMNSGAFERDPANDFYRDNSGRDNMALGAIELFEWTEDQAYLTSAIANAPASANWLSWGDVGLIANTKLGAYDATAAATALSEMNYFVNNGNNNIWGVPMQYTWASLTSWITAAGAGGVYHRVNPSHSGSQELLNNIVDYTFGKNNWGLTFIATPNLSNSVQNIYSQIYDLTGAFPLGAVSEGPADKQMHDDQGFGWLSGDLEEFNTSGAVFYDDSRDYVTQEAVIVGQAVALLMLAHSLPPGSEVSSSSVIPISSSSFSPEVTEPLPFSQTTWFAYDDRSETGGASVATLNSNTTTLVSATLAVNPGTLGYQYAGLGFEFSGLPRDLSEYDGLLVRMNLESGSVVRFSLNQTDILDYDYPSRSILGQGETVYRIPFSQLNQAGWGTPVPLNLASVAGAEFIHETSGSTAEISVTAIEFYRESLTPVSYAPSVPQNMGLRYSNGFLQLNLPYEQKAEITIYSTVGASLQTLQVSGVGAHQLRLSSGVESYQGILLVQVKSGSHVQSLKFIP
jgi:hypothetical protein